MARHVRYGIYPPEARTLAPVAHGQPDLLEIDIGSLAATGMREVIETAQGAVALHSMLNQLLVAETPTDRSMRWSHGGVGIGAEMKRGFSAILGRFVARWYLEVHHGLTNFTPINGSGDYTVVHHDLIIGRENSALLLPDWVCLAPGGGINLAEAKGRHDRTNWAAPINARPLNDAVEQLGNARVQLKPPGGAAGLPELLETKGWGVMSRWATEENGVAPLLFVHDPSTVGRLPEEGESFRTAAAVRRSSLARTMDALDHPSLASALSPRLSQDDLVSIRNWIESSPQPMWTRDRGTPRDRSLREARDIERSSPSRSDLERAQPRQAFSIDTELLADKRYIGCIVDVAGRPLSEPAASVIRARSSTSESILENLYFAGIDIAEIESTITDGHLPEKRAAVTIQTEQSGSYIPVIRSFADGFILAPISFVSEREDDIGETVAKL